MKHLLWVIVVYALAATSVLAQEEWPTLTGPFLGQPLPGPTPQKFASGVISTDEGYELNAVFSPDQRIFMFTREIDGVAKMHYSFRNGEGVWSAPRLASPSLTYPHHADVDMAFAPEGQRLYFISKRPLEGHALETYNLWYSDRSPEGLHSPVALGPRINGPGHEFYPWIVGDGSLYFTAERPDSIGSFDSYRAQFRDGRFDAPVHLGAAINSEHREGDIFVNADESILVHVSTGRPDSLGDGDLYISFRQEDGAWGQDRHLGDGINSPEFDFCPVITPDGEYFFFSRAGDLYWMEAATLERYRD
ncbi:MAG: hypothetical protein AAFX85_02165 [Pseudomonadota bacterium]